MAKLKYGVVVAGVAHFDFDLRTPTVGDNIAAGEIAGVGASDLAFKTALLAECMTRLGTIPKGEITYALLCDLDEDEFDLVWDELLAVKKKTQQQKLTAETSASQP